MTDFQHSTGFQPNPVADLASTDDFVKLYGTQFQEDPAALYAQIRQQHGGVAPVLLDGDVPAWLVIGYREIHQVTSDNLLYQRDTRRWNQWDNVPSDWPLLPYVAYNPSVMFTEALEHRRRAGAIGDALSAVDQFDLRSHCERIADQLIDAFAGSGEADLIAQFAMQIPLLAVAKMYGMPEAETPALVRDVAISLDVGPDAIPAYGRVQEAMGRLLAGKHQRPGADVPSHMVQHPAQLTDAEIIQDLLVVTAAAQQPTANWIGNTIRLMLTDDRFAASLFGGRNSVAEAMNEVLWEDTPTQNVAGRWASRDTQLAGRRIRAGDLLLLGLQGANSDPQVRTDGAALTGGNNAHFSFGHGEHRCPFPAQEVAEVIARTGIEVVLDRLPDIDLAVPAESLTRRPSPWLRGLTELPVRFTPVPAL